MLNAHVYMDWVVSVLVIYIFFMHHDNDIVSTSYLPNYNKKKLMYGCILIMCLYLIGVWV